VTVKAPDWETACTGGKFDTEIDEPDESTDKTPEPDTLRATRFPAFEPATCVACAGTAAPVAPLAEFVAVTDPDIVTESVPEFKALICVGSTKVEPFEIRIGRVLVTDGASPDICDKLKSHA